MIVEPRWPVARALGVDRYWACRKLFVAETCGEAKWRSVVVDLELFVSQESEVIADREENNICRSTIRKSRNITEQSQVT